MSYEKELEFAKSLALEAGGIMRRYFRSEDIGTTWKQDDTPLTVADTTINSLVIERVKDEFPDHGVLGEEESYETKRDFIWVVDPIDGTSPFALGIPVSTFSAALVDRKDGQPVVAVVYDPYLDHLYTAVKGKGAYLNGNRIKTSSATSLDRQTVYMAGGFKPGTRHYDIGRCLDLVRDANAKGIVVASFIYFGCKVASGELVGALVGLGSPWDLATVALIAAEAGAVVTDAYGNGQRYDGETKGIIVAANPEIHTMLMKIVKAAHI